MVYDSICLKKKKKKKEAKSELLVVKVIVACMTQPTTLCLICNQPAKTRRAGFLVLMTHRVTNRWAVCYITSI